MIFCSDILCFAKSDMIAYGNRDIETCTFSDILFAVKLPQAITLAVRRIKLPKCPLEHLGNRCGFTPLIKLCIYFAKSIARLSLITWIFICPGYLSSSSIRFTTSCAIITILSSLICSGLTMILTSRPA